MISENMIRPPATELQFAFDALIIKSDELSPSDELSCSMEMKTFLQLCPEAFRKHVLENLHPNVSCSNHQEKHSYDLPRQNLGAFILSDSHNRNSKYRPFVILMNQLNEQHKTQLCWNINRKEDYEINNIRTRALNLSWFARIFLTQALLEQLEKFDPYVHNRNTSTSKAKDIFDAYKAYNQTTGFINSILRWIGKYFFELDRFETLIQDHQPTEIQDRQPTDNSDLDDKNDDPNDSQCLQSNQQQQVHHGSPIRAKVQVFKLEEEEEDIKNDLKPH